MNTQLLGSFPLLLLKEVVRFHISNINKIYDTANLLFALHVFNGPLEKKTKQTNKQQQTTNKCLNQLCFSVYYIFYNYSTFKTMNISTSHRISLGLFLSELQLADVS